MPILRAGPWGNLIDCFQVAEMEDAYPVNCAKANWPNQPWAAFYEEEGGCSGPATITATSTLSGTQQLTSIGGENCLYQWINPSGEYFGRLEIYLSSGQWFYDQAFSYATFDTAYGPTTPDDPTGTYTSYQGTFTVITP